jgi:hypothetical protein
VEGACAAAKDKANNIWKALQKSQHDLNAAQQAKASAEKKLEGAGKGLFAKLGGQAKRDQKHGMGVAWGRWWVADKRHVEGCQVVGKLQVQPTYSPRCTIVPNTYTLLLVLTLQRSLKRH